MNRFWLAVFGLTCAISCGMNVCTSQRAEAQSSFSGTPQSNLGPIQLPSGTGNGQFGSGNGAFPAPTGLTPFSTPATGFDPYSTGASPLSGAPNFAGATVTPLGPPTPVGAPTVSAGPSTFAPSPFGNAPVFGAPPPVVGGTSPTGGSSAYPNGSLLGGLFSGNWFRGRNSPSYQGAGFPTNSIGSGLPSAAPYNAPSVYGPAPGGMYGNGPIFGGSGLGGSGLSGAGGYPTGQVFPNSQAYQPSTGFPGSPFSGATDPFPSTAYPSGSPNSLFPGGMGGSGGLFPSGLFPSGNPLANYQLLHGPRLRHTFVSGGDDVDEVGYNQTDASIGFAFPNFLYSNRPLFVVPSFSLYLFDGPASQPAKPSDLPGSAYGGYLDFGWQTDPNQIIGAELGVRVGAYTDFDTFNDDSIRVMGKGLASFRLTPASTIKAGVYYLDRQSIKLLPAGGWLWQPNPYTRLDVFFPEPKFARYWRTIGTQDVWWYFAGEYGGDSWTISRASVNREERVDLNQIGITFGMEWGRSEWIRAGRRTAFLEAGVVFDRELDYEISPHDRDLNEAFMFRAGFGY